MGPWPMAWTADSEFLVLLVMNHRSLHSRSSSGPAQEPLAKGEGKRVVEGRGGDLRQRVDGGTLR